MKVVSVRLRPEKTSPALSFSTEWPPPVAGSPGRTYGSCGGQNSPEGQILTVTASAVNGLLILSPKRDKLRGPLQCGFPGSHVSILCCFVCFCPSVCFSTSPLCLALSLSPQPFAPGCGNLSRIPPGGVAHLSRPTHRTQHRRGCLSFVSRHWGQGAGSGGCCHHHPHSKLNRGLCMGAFGVRTSVPQPSMWTLGSLPGDVVVERSLEAGKPQKLRINPVSTCKRVKTRAGGRKLASPASHSS